MKNQTIILLESLKQKVNETWIISTQEKDSKRRAALLKQYRELKRQYELQLELTLS